jgi:putative acetyltransferase
VAFTAEYKSKTDDIITMFAETFTQSEGTDAGELIKGLVSDMLTTLTADEMRVFSAVEDGAVLGSIIFTRLTYEQDARTVFILAPVAVSISQQGKGLGQRLIRHGLKTLQSDGVKIALTYGDINFYSKVGFSLISEADAQAPRPLQYPEGWLGQSLSGDQFEPLQGPSRCVAPLNDPNHW